MAANPFNEAAYVAAAGAVPPAEWEGPPPSGWGAPAPPPRAPGALSPGALYSPPAPAAAAEGPAQALARREAELSAREAELRRLEQELRVASGEADRRNWPPLCPVAHHDINGDIPPEARRMVREAYAAYLGLVFCLLFNFFCTSAALGVLGSDYIGSFLWAAIYMLGGIPGAFFSWYMRAYAAGQHDRALSYVGFFCLFPAHLVFSIWSAVAPPFAAGKSHAGFMAGLGMLRKSTGVGVVYLIGASFWSIESLWSVWLLQDMYMHFRGGNRRGQIASEGLAMASRGV